MIHLYSSNRLEWLVERLAESVDHGTVFVPETVIVQSRGMERWLKLQMARQSGVCANVVSPFPKSFICDCLQRTVGMPATDHFSKDTLRWRIYELLKSDPRGQEFEIPLNYLKGTGRDTKVYQLSGRVADLYDEYQAYRPNSILSWSGNTMQPFRDAVFEASEHEVWQRAIWETLHRSADRQGFLEQLVEFMQRDLSADRDQLPERVHLFGMSTLPPVFMSFFEKLSTVVDLHIFYLSPCKEFWEDCVREGFKLQQELLKDGGTYWEIGNPLLSSMGVQGRDFSRVINSLENIGREESRFVSSDEIGGATLLQTVQGDMLTLNPVDDEPRLSEVDDTIQIHTCHSPMREIEVLYDQLLAAMNKDETLRPRDILVMTPDVAKYAPYIKAVFDNPEESGLRVPYSIADKSPGQDNPVAEAFLAILNIYKTRFTAVDVLDVFAVEAVHLAYGVSAKDLDLVRRWVVESGIRWGVDGGYKQGLDLPELEQNTWKFGLDRLMMGYAMPSQEGIVQGVLPMDVEGAESEVLGRFMEFWYGLRAVLQQQKGTAERTCDQWEDFLGAIVSTFFEESEETDDDLREVSSAISRMIGHLRDSGIACDINREAVICELEGMLCDDALGSGFIHGGVTFCRLRPMRSIPARMICLVGMNEGDFPHQCNTSGFDLIAKRRCPGDRNGRLDDRYLFMESIISARDTLYISYIGRSIKDNTVQPPSILVSELLDYLRQRISDRDGRSTELLTTEHPLQAFNPAYFEDGDRLVSYSAANCRSAEANRGVSRSSDGEVYPVAGLQSPVSPKEEIYLGDLVRFFGNPARSLIRERLNTRLGLQEVERPEIDEPFDWNQSDFFRNSEIVDEIIGQSGDLDSEGYYQRFLASGEMPVGVSGKALFDAHLLELGDFSRQVIHLINGESLAPVPVHVETGMGVSIIGEVGNVLPVSGIFNYRYAKSKEKLYIKTWIEGLCLSCVQGSPVPAKLLYRNDKQVYEQFEFPEPDRCREYLTELVDLYNQGMNLPLAFFPQASMKLVEKLGGDESAIADQGELDKAITSVESKWKGGQGRYGESDDEYFEKAFGENWFTDATEEELRGFAQTAMTVYRPLLHHLGVGDQ